MSTNANSIIYNNVEYNSLSDLCKSHGISTQLYSSRKHNGLSIDECLSKERRGGTKIEHEGVVYESIAKLCAAYEVPQSIFYYRKKKGLDIDGCLEEV